MIKRILKVREEMDALTHPSSRVLSVKILLVQLVGGGNTHSFTGSLYSSCSQLLIKMYC